MRIICFIKDYQNAWDAYRVEICNDGPYSEEDLIERIEILIRNGHDINYSEKHHYAGSDERAFTCPGANALWWATKLVLPKVATFLIKNGADAGIAVQEGYFKGTNALWQAIYRSLESATHASELRELAKLLITKGADVNARFIHDNVSVIRLAIATGNQELVGLLIAGGATDTHPILPRIGYVMAPNDQFIKNTFILLVVRDYFFHRIIQEWRTVSWKTVAKELGAFEIRNAINALQKVLAEGAKTKTATAQIWCRVQILTEFGHTIIANELPIELNIRVAKYLLPARMQDIFKLSDARASRLTEDLLRSIEQLIADDEMREVLLAAQNDLINFYENLSQTRHAYAVNKRKIAKVIFSNIEPYINVSALARRQVFRDAFLPAFTTMVAKNRLDIFCHTRRQEITNNAAAMFARPHNQAVIPTQQQFTTLLNKH